MLRDFSSLKIEFLVFKSLTSNLTRSYLVPLMAQIILDPNESFEHTHSTDSTTILREGQGTLKTGGKEIEMVKDKEYPIPAGQSHTITNKSALKNQIICIHR